MRAFHLVGTSEAARKSTRQSLLSPCCALSVTEISKGWNSVVPLVGEVVFGSRETDKVSFAFSVLRIHRTNTGIPLFTLSVLRDRIRWPNAGPEHDEFPNDKAIDNADTDYRKATKPDYWHERTNFSNE
ncbi:hypothetical protein OZX67_00690 [Bifidobacterium sp. ESL0728]|uniref:hypothetical protein n=1 Tax=Bifidobacterium sp. ESL0728 TaxID=2983220 RepID=UPI0023F877FD|nr:hypothetical protein [Bifidobacterium sp. ESL0728]WEV59127.1 hypothetical protein OZX67_00690 [Bifidobacterium sp. ESL0728]